VIASGVRAKGLPDHPPGANWPGVLIGPGSPIVAQDYSGLSVAVLGGGDNAFENYVYVRNRGARHPLLLRAPGGMACASAPIPSTPRPAAWTAVNTI